MQGNIRFVCALSGAEQKMLGGGYGRVTRVIAVSRRHAVYVAPFPEA